jgi:hypothetical protein
MASMRHHPICATSWARSSSARLRRSASSVRRRSRISRSRSDFFAVAAFSFSAIRLKERLRSPISSSFVTSSAKSKLPEPTTSVPSRSVLIDLRVRRWRMKWLRMSCKATTATIP